MNNSMDKTITRLMLSALDQADMSGEDWQARLKIPRAKLDRLRSGAATFSDLELDRISRVFGEPWPSLILGQLGDDSSLSKETINLLANLNALQQTASAERQPKPARLGDAKRRARRLRTAKIA